MDRDIFSNGFKLMDMIQELQTETDNRVRHNTLFGLLPLFGRPLEESEVLLYVKTSGEPNFESAVNILNMAAGSGLIDVVRSTPSLVDENHPFFQQGLAITEEAAKIRSEAAKFLSESAYLT